MAATDGTGACALQALMAAALLLPGVASLPAQAQDDSGLALQAARHHEAPRRGDGRAPVTAGLDVSTLTLRHGAPLGEGALALDLGYTQDTWSGATPVATAPRVAGTNRPVQRSAAGQLVTVGASPMITGSLLLDGADRPLQRGTDGVLRVAPDLVHTLSSASPETRRQLDLKLTRRLADGSLSGGGGASVERDQHAQFMHLARRFDDGPASVTVAVNATRSRMASTLDHDAAPYITRSAYADRIDTSGGRLLLHGRRTELGASAGFTRALTPSALFEATLSYAHSRGDLNNPYKVTSVVFAPQTTADDGVRSGELRALLEQRPQQRRQWNAGARLVLHHAGLDGALHLGAGLFSDDWGVQGQRLQLQWLQPLAPGSMVSATLRHHSQSAARFYTPCLVSHQPYRQLSVAPDGQVTVRSFDPALLPAHFSSDQRLAAFGSLSAGLGWNQRLDNGVAFDLSFERTQQSGRLKWGGGGEGRYADLSTWTAQASVSLSFGDGAPAAADAGHDHGHAPHDVAPAELGAAHGAPGRGRWMLGLRQVQSRWAGTLKRGRHAVDDTELATRACGDSPCLSAPTAMGHRMQMLDLMLGLDEHWSLMLMPQFMAMDMDHRLLPGAVADDRALHLGRHESAGWGDTQLHLLRHGGGTASPRWVLGLGLSLPTGSTSQTQRRMHQQDGTLLDATMQPGSGSLDLLPSATLQGGSGPWLWGAQICASTRLRSVRAHGPAWGLRWQASGWAGRRLGPAVAVTTRASWRVDHGQSGTAGNATTQATSPDSLASNQGGRFADLGLGLSLTPGGGAGSLALEHVQPLYADVRGYQLPPRGRWALSWQRGF